eukprot:CAMPEP_0170289230 /NCGR_PEP_ID=MMETSP0116_2-20130129/44680_1 /TAXON_ID=400756 /ORGANISM="Durinskia baltica, Strain CSIRO CS-38" /LENGTH=84 /DNA_ID=CAMNT_0010540663 /DNA_START=301 /DNA_END=552 /DNA_ORIENTATION=-
MTNDTHPALQMHGFSQEHSMNCAASRGHRQPAGVVLCAAAPPDAPQGPAEQPSRTARERRPVRHRRGRAPTASRQALMAADAPA